MTLERSSVIPDQGRAEVRPAGCAVLTENLHFCHCFEMMGSLSRLLEGALPDLPAVFPEEHSF